MTIKHTIKTFLIIVVLTISAAAGIAWVRDNFSPQSLSENVWLCSAAVALIGFLMQSGASTGGDVIIDRATHSVSHNPDSSHEADSDDMRLGVSFGVVVMLSGILLFVLSLVLYLTLWG
jgi:hypothetical protein